MATHRSIKISFQGDSRVVALPMPATLGGLQAAVASTFGTDLPPRSKGGTAECDLRFSQKDVEGNYIIFEKDSELNLAIRLCSQLEISAFTKVDATNTATSVDLPPYGPPAERDVGGKRRPKRRRQSDIGLPPPDFEIPDKYGGGNERTRYSTEFKLNAIEYSRRVVPGGRAKGGTLGVKYASKVLSLPDPSSIRGWVKEEKRLRAEVTNGIAKWGKLGKAKALKAMSLHAGRRPKSADIEVSIVDWFNDLCSDEESMPVTSVMIKAEARRLKPDIFGKTPDVKDVVACKRYEWRVNKWYAAFLRRHGLSMRRVTREGRQLPEGWGGMARSAILDLRAIRTATDDVRTCDGLNEASDSGRDPNGQLRLMIGEEQTVNMDEVPVWFEPMGEDKAMEGAAVNPGGDEEKERITVVLAVTMAGEKLTPLLIFKGIPAPIGTQPAPNSIEQEFACYKDGKNETYPRELHYAVDPKGWHSQRVFNDVWMAKVWARRPGREGSCQGCLPQQPRTLLIWDDYSVHKTDQTQAAMEDDNTKTYLIRGGLAPKVQPCSGEIRKIFKAVIAREHKSYMLTAIREDNGYPESPSRGLVAQWVAKAWEAVDKDTILRSWKKCGLMLPLDGSGDEEWSKEHLFEDMHGNRVDKDGSI